MKTKTTCRPTAAAAVAGLAAVFALAFPAWAADQVPDWRPTYDLIMMWVNFLILFGVLYKFLKTPLSDFFKGKKYELEKEIQKAEEQKELAEAKIEESMRMLDEGEERFKKIKEKIVARGEANKARIIEEAKEQSEFMLAEAKRKIDNQILRARDSYRAELLDLAFDKVMERMPEIITEEDGQRLVERYISEAMAA